MTDVPQWGAPYPDAGALRSDVDAMVDAFAAALVDRFGGAIGGLWFKGSAQRQWDSPIDYVPEISDVDIHVRTARPDEMASIRDPGVAAEIHADIDRRFTAARPSPVHIPRVQYVAAEEVEKIPGYVPAPPSAARTLYGAQHRGPDQIDQAAVVRADRDRILLLADESVLTKATVDLLERPRHHLAWGLRSLNWRVSPMGPLVLSLTGLDYMTVWSSNRTAIVRLLREQGTEELSASYIAYYSNGWAFWLSGWQDGGAGRSAFLAGLRTIRLAAAIAEAAGPSGAA